MKKPVKLGLWLLGFAVLALLGLWLEHERAKARLAAFKAQLIAKGEKLDIADYVPKLPPAISNAAPDFIAAADRLTKLDSMFQPPQMRFVAPGRARVTWQQAELPTDKDPDLWPIVIAHVEDNRHLLAEMATALERPEMVFPSDYAKGFELLLPHLAKMKKAATTLSLASMTDLHQGQTSLAFNHWLASVRIGRRFEESLLISQLVRVAIAHIGVQTTWEALQSTAWSDSQLATMQTAWQEFDGAKIGPLAWGMERAYAIEETRRMRLDGARALQAMELVGGAFPGSSPSGSFLELLWEDPASAGNRAAQQVKLIAWRFWYSYADEQLALQQGQVNLEGARQAAQSQNFAAANAATTAALRRLPEPGPLFILSRDSPLVSSSSIPKRFAQFETVRRLTFTAIALRRHRLKHGKFPESLGALVPEFLGEVPRDFMDGQPLRYQRQPDGQFLIWSVGEDFKDDGGDTNPLTPPSSDEALNWLKGRDWVWPQAASEAEVATYHAELAAKRAGSPPKKAP